MIKGIEIKSNLAHQYCTLLKKIAKYSRLVRTIACLGNLRVQIPSVLSLIEPENLLDVSKASGA